MTCARKVGKFCWAGCIWEQNWERNVAVPECALHMPPPLQFSTDQMVRRETALVFLVPPGVRLTVLLFWLPGPVILWGNFFAPLLLCHGFHHSREANRPSSIKENSLSPADCLCWGVLLSIVSTVAGRISPYWYHLGSIKSTFFIWRIQVQMSSYFWLVLPWTWLDR